MRRLEDNQILYEKKRKEKERKKNKLCINIVRKKERKKEGKKKQIIMTIKKVMWRMLEQVPHSRLGLLAQVSLVHICQNSCVLISHRS